LGKGKGKALRGKSRKKGKGGGVRWCNPVARIWKRKRGHTIKSVEFSVHERMKSGQKADVGPIGGNTQAKPNALSVVHNGVGVE